MIDPLTPTVARQTTLTACKATSNYHNRRKGVHDIGRRLPGQQLASGPLTIGPKQPREARDIYHSERSEHQTEFRQRADSSHHLYDRRIGSSSLDRCERGHLQSFARPKAASKLPDLLASTDLGEARAPHLSSSSSSRRRPSFGFLSVDQPQRAAGCREACSPGSG